VTISRRRRRRRARHQLAKAALQDRRHEQHQHRAGRNLRGLAAVQGQVLDAAIAARKQYLVGDHQAARRQQHQRAELGRSVDRNPAEEIQSQVTVVVQCHKGAERKALIHVEHDGRHAGREPESERHEADECIVAEQEVGKYAEGLERARRGREDDLVEQIGPRARRAPATRHPGGDEGREPGFILQRQQEARSDPDQQRQRRDHDVPVGRSHRRRQLKTKECAQPLAQADARPVDHEVGPQHQILQVEKKIAVERNGTRNRQRGESRAVEDRQPLQLGQRQRPHAATLRTRHQSFELAPALLSPLAKFAALEDELRSAR